MVKLRWLLAAFGLCLVMLCHVGACADSYFANGSGTRDDPYLLENASDLRLMRDLLNRDPTFADGAPCFRLTANIRLNEEAHDSLDWLPVKRFTGELDGAGYAVTGLYVASDSSVRVKAGTYGKAPGGAFIAELAPGAAVRNLTLSGSVEAPSASGLALAGGFACVNHGTLENCVSYIALAVSRKAGTLWLSGVAAYNDGALLRCVDRSHLYVYPNVDVRLGDIRFAGLMAEGGGTADGCTDEARNEGISYMSVWNLYEPASATPSPEPATPAPTPTLSPSPTPSPTPTAAAPSPTPVTPTSSPASTATVPSATDESAALAALAQAVPDATAALNDALYALAGALGTPRQQEGPYAFRPNADGQSVTLMAYAGADTCIDVPGTLGDMPVTRVAAHAFAGNVQLRELTLPEGIRIIGDSAFAACENLYYIHFPDTLAELDLAVLAGCARLAAIDLPQGSTRLQGDLPIQSACFTAWAGDNVAAAAYCRERGIAVRMEQIAARSTAALQDVAVRFPPTVYTKPDAAAQQGGTDSVRQSAGGDASLTGQNWADAYFSGAATSYQHELARFSLGAALAAQPSAGQESGARAQQNAVALLLELGFHDIRCFGYSGGTGLTLVLAHKSLHTAAGETTLVAALPGSGGEDGWLAALRMYSASAPDMHAGLSAAADEAYASLQAYWAQLGISGDPCALWLAGYGRAGAVASLLAERCNTDSLAQGSLYAYVFGAPAVMAQGQAVDGLYSIQCPSDPVPALPPASWGLGQGGAVYAFPTGTGGSGATASRFDVMLRKAEQMRASSWAAGDAPPYARLLGEGDTALLPVRSCLLALYGFVMPSPAAYAAGYEALLADASARGASDWQRATQCLHAVLNAPVLTLAQGAPGLSLAGALKAYFASQASAEMQSRLQDMLASTEKPEAYPTVTALLAGHDVGSVALTAAEISDCAIPALRDAASLLMSMHSPEVYLGWAMSVDGSDMAAVTGGQ